MYLLYGNTYCTKSTGNTLQLYMNSMFCKVQIHRVDVHVYNDILKSVQVFSSDYTKLICTCVFTDEE